MCVCDNMIHYYDPLQSISYTFITYTLVRSSRLAAQLLAIQKEWDGNFFLHKKKDLSILPKNKGGRTVKMEPRERKNDPSVENSKVGGRKDPLGCDIERKPTLVSLEK